MNSKFNIKPAIAMFGIFNIILFLSIAGAYYIFSDLAMTGRALITLIVTGTLTILCLPRLFELFNSKPDA